MKHVKVFEDYNEIGNDDEYLQSDEEIIEYFIETYYNGQFGQLEKLLFSICDRGTDVVEKMINAISYDPEKDNIYKWVIKKLAEEAITI
jgi:hypothetical protein